MSPFCTPEQIAEKRRIAEERLKQKLAANASASCTTVNSNRNNSNNGVLLTKPTIAFYDKQSSNSKKPISTSNSLNPKQNCYKTFISTVARELPVNQESKLLQNKDISYVSKPILYFGTKITCEVSMTSSTKFVVKPSKYHEQLICVFKTIPSKQYDANTRLWSFDISDYEILQERGANLKPEVELDQIPNQVLGLLRKPSEDFDFSYLPSIETKLVNSLMQFQKEGVCFGIEKKGCVLIADEMGLGKTLQALAIADFFRDDWPILITTTASTRNSWFTHVKDYLPSIRCHDIVTLNSSEFYINDAKIVITSYSIMEKHVEKLLERKFGILIFDESHNLKSFEAKRTKNAEKLARVAKRIILLSGTPALSKPVELYCQIKMLDKSFLPFKAFSKRYCDGKQTNFGWDSSGQSNLAELNIVLKKKYMIRRLKSEVLSQLAEKNRETVILNPHLIKLSEEVRKNFKDMESKLTQGNLGHQSKEILISYYAKTAEIKARAVCDYLKSIIKEKKKFILFAHHKFMMNSISDFLFANKVDFIRIDGATKGELRDDNVKRFQTKDSCKVALLSLHTCNAGITLTAADLVVFAELDWNPSTLAQAESRAHRIGQQNTVTCRYLLAEHTADTIIWKMLKEKQDVLNNAGLFSESLQNAQPTLASTNDQKIEKYFTPNKRKTEDFYGATSVVSSKKIQNSESNISPPCNQKIDKYFTPTKRKGENCESATSSYLTNENQTTEAKKLKVCDTLENRNNKILAINDVKNIIKVNNVQHSYNNNTLNLTKSEKTTSNKSTKSTENEYDFLFNELDDADIPRTPAIIFDKSSNSKKNEARQQQEQYDDLFGELEDTDFADLGF